MLPISERCLISGADGHVTVTPAGRVALTSKAPALRGSDLDRIADEVGADVALRTVAANGGTAALFEERDHRLTLTLTGAIGALLELPTAEWFVMPTGPDGHTMTVPAEALRLAVALGAVSPADLTPSTAASITTPDGQTASQFVIELGAGEASDPTPVGLEVIDLSIAADAPPSPLPVVAAPSTPDAPPAPQPPAPAIIPPQPGRDAQPPPPQPPAPQPVAPAPQPQPQPAAPGPPAAATPPAEEHDDWVLGIRCPLDHHNHPEAEYCAQCGRKMGINATAVYVKGPRPPLGLFLLDDGGAIPIATDLLIGRDATTHDEVRRGERQAVLLTDASNVVSRHHLAITLEDWDVTVTDLGSANGTLHVQAANGSIQPLTPHRPVELRAGDTLRIGPRTLQLQLHHVA